ncbi:hypothetical protein GXM_07455 [Nostoc sphaeroides CCNUC1]|uniref:Uncharacterized protein n=1 Tax=Nostoc sphaeroides CCNUC1 TaxID=2653204 RepID=A0A5P8WBM9_9NOSO|nr:hypothetical protein GXM_07455 [Nostoc sphaeroides CCNUC1]
MKQNLKYRYIELGTGDWGLGIEKKIKIKSHLLNSKTS